MNNDQFPQLERINAYLDGELSPEEGAQVVQQLASDQEFRNELQGIERAWAALDQLPRADVGDEFSRTTMELVVDAARQDVAAKTIAMPVQRRRRGTRTALLAAMAMLLGALVFRVGWRNPNRQLLADLPVIQNIDIYSQFRRVDFLQQLQGLLGNDTRLSAAEEEQLDAKFQEFQLIASTDDRADWLELLTDDDKPALRAKYNRFRDLPADSQAKLRLLHERVESDEESEQLVRTMFRYQQWLAGLPASKQYELRGLSATERAREVAREMQRPRPDQRFELTPEQLRKLKEVVRPVFEEMFRKNMAQSPDGPKRLQKMSDRERLRELFRTLRESPEQMERLNEAILEALPDGVRQEFEALPRWERGPIVVRWLRQSRARALSDRRNGERLRPGEVPEQELTDFFVDELSPEQKERLLTLPRDQMRQQLQRLYRGEHEPHHDRFDRRGPPDRDMRPPPGERRPPGGRRPPRDRGEEFRGPPPRGPRGGGPFRGRPEGPPPRTPEQ